ncbi:hypothetical protein [Actinokineospora sp. HUAS TT18]|uniref:hypothetical protein n=1 Tax=Actinokineospora sp. HUAS TT18 TaxID=3447451 RepID=UPI003F520BB4
MHPTYEFPTYRLRWPYVLLMAAGIGAVTTALTWVAVLLTVGPSTPVTAGLVGGAVASTAVVAGLFRQATMEVRPEGIVQVSRGVEVSVAWSDLEREQVGGIGPVRWDEIVFRSSTIRPLPPRKSVPASTLRMAKWRDLDRRVPVSLFIEDWRATELGHYVAKLRG